MASVSVISFLKKIYALPNGDGPRCFRGQFNRNWALVPSVMRSLKRDAERNIISELMLETPEYFDRDRSMFQKLVRAQHYGLPTRLLDVTLNPLVALFFACFDNGGPSKAVDGKVLIFDFKPNRVKFSDSDTISLISNLANLSDSEREHMDRQIDSIPDIKARKSALNELDEAKKLVSFVRRERPYFAMDINPGDFKKYFFVYPYKNNKRIIAQSGAFIASGFLNFKHTHKTYSFSLEEIVIPKRNKAEILHHLDKININHKTLFPEVEFASKYIRDNWVDRSEKDAVRPSHFQDIFS